MKWSWKTKVVIQVVVLTIPVIVAYLIYGEPLIFAALISIPGIVDYNWCKFKSEHADDDETD